MRKPLLLLFAALLLAISPSLKAQCYGTVNYDQSAQGNGASTFTISTAFSNELILISTDGWEGPFTGSVTVDGNPATQVASSSIPTIDGGEALVWAYSAPAAGVHTIVVVETGFSASYNLNFASAFYSTGSCTPLGLSNLTTTQSTTGVSSHSVSDIITTTEPNSMIYSTAEYNTGSYSSLDLSFTGALEEGGYHENNGIDAGEAYTSATTAGSYTVTAADGNSSYGAALILVAIQPPPCGVSVTISSTTNPTCSGSNGSIMASASGGTTPYTYSWSPSGGTNATASNLSAGTYTITVTDHTGCMGTASATLTTSNTLTATATINSNVLCNGNSNGSATINPVGGATPYTYSWNPNGYTAQTVSTLSAGTYTVTVSDNSGCTTTTSVTITQPTTLGISIASQTNVLCNGSSTGSITANAATGGTAPYTYNWTPSGGTNPTASNLSAGTYTITATDNNGCTATASATITQPTALSISIASQTNVLCNGSSTGSATANAATGGATPYTYNWTPSGGTNLTASNLSAGTYTITATDNNGCIATASATITQPTALSITIASQTDLLCNGNSNGSATANAATGGTAPYTYNWAPSGGTNLNASNLSAGTYTITATDNSGCTATASVTITQPNALTITIQSVTGVLCNGGPTGTATANIPNGGTSPYTYNWTPSGGTGLTASNLSAGTYTITATDNNGCTATASATITQPNTLSITIASEINVLCNGLDDGSATANVPNGGSLPYTYVWNPGGQTNLTASNLSAGSYTITATDNNGCTASASVTISQPANGVAISIASITNVACNGNSSGSITATVASGGTAPYTYNWTPSGGTGLTASNLSAGSYTITVTDNNGCTDTASATVTQPATAVAINIASQTNILCVPNSGSATANPASGGTGPYTYAWAPSGGTNLTASNLSAGTYTINATDNNGCTASASVTITQSGTTLYIAIASRTTLACAGMGYISSQAATGGTPPYNYVWAPSGGTNLTTITTLGAGTYTITATDSNGCTATASETITLPPTLSIAVSGVSVSGCFGNSNGSASAAPSGGTLPYTYAWSPSGGTNATVSGLSAGTYTVTLTDSNGCTAIDAVTLTQPAGMVISADSISSTLIGGCNGEAAVTVVSGGTAPFTYLWSPGGATTDTIKGECVGDYCCTVTDANGCSQTVCVVIPNTSSVATVNGNGSSVNIYPNPSNGLFNVQSALGSGQMTVEVYNTLGQKVYSQFTINQLTFTIDLSSQPNGIYLIRILGKDGSLVDEKKVVKMN